MRVNPANKALCELIQTLGKNPATFFAKRQVFQTKKVCKTTLGGDSATA